VDLTIVNGVARDEIKDGLFHAGGAIVEFYVFVPLWDSLLKRNAVAGSFLVLSARPVAQAIVTGCQRTSDIAQPSVHPSLV
jgi:hypothetical protein